MSERAYCKHPDRHVPEIVCGHPLPCPYHTVIIDETGEVPVISIPVTNAPPINKKQLKIIKDIANVLKD
jgi:hypothetical protein